MGSSAAKTRKRENSARRADQKHGIGNMGKVEIAENNKTWNSASYAEGTSEYHRNALRGIAKTRGARGDLELGLETSKPRRLRRPRADAGCAAGERWRCQISSLRGASSTAGLRPSRRRWLQGGRWRDSFLILPSKTTGRADVALTWHRRFREVGVLAERHTNRSSGNDSVRVQDQRIILDRQRVPAENIFSRLRCPISPPSRTA